MAATQAPDTAAMIASQSKIIECSTGEFGVQAPLYSSVLAEAYQAANVKVAVSDMRAAVERHNDDGSVDVLVAVRVKVTNSEAADQESGLPAAGADGARRRHLQDRPAGSGRLVTAVLDATPESAADDSVPEQPTASWLARAGAFAVDVLLGVAVIATMALLTLSAPQRGWLWWVFTSAAVVVFLLMAINRLVLPTITGWSLGRALFGIAVRKRDGSPVGLARLAARDLAHLLDTAALFIGWLWPLWDRRGPHVRRSAAAHRGAQGRPPAARICAGLPQWRSLRRRSCARPASV